MFLGHALWVDVSTLFRSPLRLGIDGTLTEITLCIRVDEQVQWGEMRKHQPSAQHGRAKGEFKDQILREI